MLAGTRRRQLEQIHRRKPRGQTAFSPGFNSLGGDPLPIASPARSAKRSNAYYATTQATASPPTPLTV
ncbi:hypothetical protein LNQ03_08240 [Klebsiella pneumoniae subsp. pneumoniae]|nr:hypothetical protein [Klebsiella pneumoniae subsp. pneumoniae]